MRHKEEEDLPLDLLEILRQGGEVDFTLDYFPRPHTKEEAEEIIQRIEEMSKKNLSQDSNE